MEKIGNRIVLVWVGFILVGLGPLIYFIPWNLESFDLAELLFYLVFILPALGLLLLFLALIRKIKSNGVRILSILIIVVVLFALFYWSDYFNRLFSSVWF